MQVKALAARYEAAASATPPHPTSPSPPPAPDSLPRAQHIENGQVKKLRDRLERAVQQAHSHPHPKPKSPSPTPPPPAPPPPPPSQQQHNSPPHPDVTLDSPRAVEVAQFGDAHALHTVVPASVAQAAPAHHPVSPCSPHVDDLTKQHTHASAPDHLATTPTNDAEGGHAPPETGLRSDGAGSSAQGSLSRSEWTMSESMSGSASVESYDSIQPIEDVSEGDLDDIDGVEHVEDFDSQEDGDGDGDRFHRQETVEVLDDDTPSAHSPPEFASDDTELDGYQGAPVHVEYTESDDGSITSYDETLSGSERLAVEIESQKVLEDEAITSVEDSEDGNSDGFESADEEFETRTMPVGSGSKVWARRPRVQSSLGVGGGRDGEGDGRGQGIGDRGSALSFKKLPKAKVMIARRRGHSVNLDGREDTEQPKAHATLSMDERGSGARRLVREYSNPSELLTGQVSMVEMVPDDDDEERDGEGGGAEKGGKALEGGLIRKHRRENEFKNRYDEFLDAEELGGKRVVVSDEDESLERDQIEDEYGAGSKQRYGRRVRLFGRSGRDREKMRMERRERHAENVQRRSSMLSGALDRVSMAADPWIDFITDANALPGGRRPFRDAMKKLFRRKGNDLIKN